MGSLSNGHHTLYWNYEIKSKLIDPPFRKSLFNFNKGNYDSFSEFIRGINWIHIFEGEYIEEMYSKFVSFYELGCEKFIPKRNYKDKKNEQILVYKGFKKINKEKIFNLKSLFIKWLFRK